MSVVPLLVFCSLALATCGVLFFLYSTRSRDHQHADRLSLLPLEEDAEPAERSTSCEQESQSKT
ncbi:MAG: cytochrome oxidase [Planctomycetota bacterium]|jgi:hypothetical protein